MHVDYDSERKHLSPQWVSFVSLSSKEFCYKSKSTFFRIFKLKTQFRKFWQNLYRLLKSDKYTKNIVCMLFVTSK